MASSRGGNKNEKKLALLAVIKEKKDVLFGKFTSELDNKKKKEAWGEVLLKAKSLQMVTADRDIDFVRDKLFGVWKSRALEKRDNRRKTGTGGGKERVLNEVDWAVIDIIGRESPVVEGLGLGETGDAIPALSEDECVTDNQADASVTEETFSTSKGQQRAKKRLCVNADSVPIQKRIKEELIEIQIYKTKLEALKLERELKLPSSKYTKEFDCRLILETDIIINSGQNSPFSESGQF